MDLCILCIIDHFSLQVKVAPTFDSIGLKEDLLRGIYAYNFEKPSAIQQRGMMKERELCMHTV